MHCPSSSLKTMKNHEFALKTIENHEFSLKTMKNHFRYINRIASRIESKQVDLSDSETVLDCDYLDGCACEQESTCIRQSGEWLSAPVE